MATPKGVAVVVVGSANLDIVVAVKRFPAPGETVLGGKLIETAGGKGLNQAVAAAPLPPWWAAWATTAPVRCSSPDWRRRAWTRVTFVGS